ncbi:MAG: hypothetical protein ACOY0T_30000 [Myxococcota bacterium]
MANRTRIQGQNQGEAVSADIHRAAKRMGFDPGQTDADGLPTAVEVEALRDLASKALRTFERIGSASPDGKEVLLEALLCARDDIELFENAPPELNMAFCRAQYRIDLAIALADYVDEFGLPETAERREAREMVAAEFASAEQGEP